LTNSCGGEKVWVRIEEWKSWELWQDREARRLLSSLHTFSRVEAEVGAAPCVILEVMRKTAYQKLGAKVYFLF